MNIYTNCKKMQNKFIEKYKNKIEKNIYFYIEKNIYNIIKESFSNNYLFSINYYNDNYKVEIQLDSYIANVYYKLFYNFFIENKNFNYKINIKLNKVENLSIEIAENFKKIENEFIYSTDIYYVIINNIKFYTDDQKSYVYLKNLSKRYDLVLEEISLLGK